MTASSDARTPSATVHALSGSTPPGTGPVLQPFGVATAPAAVAELPDTFVPLGSAAAGVVADLAGRRAASSHPDADVIDLAERLKALWRRQDALHGRLQEMVKQVEAAHPRPAKPVSNEAFHAYYAEIRPTEQRIGLILLRRVRRRQSDRLGRWLVRLTASEPNTWAGLAAKAGAFLVSHDAEWPGGFDDLEVEISNLAASQARDAVRIATLPDPVRHAGRDDELVRLHREWEASGVRCQTLSQATDAARKRMTRPSVPDALRFRASTDATCIGAYQNRSGNRPHGYTDPAQVDLLRRGVAPSNQARCDEIVNAFDAWQAAIEADKAASGYLAASAAWGVEIDRHNEIERQIARTSAVGRDGLAAKMAIALWGFADDDDVVTDEEIVQEIEHQISRGEEEQSGAMPYSILLDLKRMLRDIDVGTGSVDEGATQLDVTRAA